MSKPSTSKEEQPQKTKEQKDKERTERRLRREAQTEKLEAKDSSTLTLNSEEEETKESSETLSDTMTQQLEAQLRDALQRIAVLENQPHVPPQVNPQADGQNVSYNGESLFAAGSSLKPSIFKGGYNPTFAEWIERFEEIAIAHKWEGNRRAEVIQLFLDGGARLAFRSLPEQTKRNYEQLKRALLVALQPVESPRFYSQLLYGPKARKLQSGENVSTYAADVQKYVLGAHPVTPEFPEAAQKQIMRESFISGLPSEMKNAIMDKEPGDFQEALTLANKIEARNYLIKGETPSTLAGGTNYQTFALGAKKFHQNGQYNYSRYSQVQGHKPQGFMYNRTQSPRVNEQSVQPNWRFSNYSKRNTFPNREFNRNFDQTPRYYSQSFKNTGDRGMNLHEHALRNSYYKFCTFCQRKGHSYNECRSKDRGQNNMRNVRYSYQRQTQFRSGNSPRGMRGKPKPYHRVNVTDTGYEQESDEHSEENASEPHEHVKDYEDRFKQLENKLDTFKDSVQVIQKQLGETALINMNPQKLYQTYPLLRPIEDKTPCEFHHSSDWEKLNFTCKDNIECPFGHALKPKSVKERCSQPNCPTDILCSVCCHNFTCTICQPSSETIHTSSQLSEFMEQNTNKTGSKFQLLFKKLTSKTLGPVRENENSAGFDIFSAYDYIIPSKSRRVCLTDLAIQIPKGCYGRIAPKSKLAVMHCIDVAAGVIEPDYHHNIGVVLVNNGDTAFKVRHGDVLAQIICERYVHVECVETEEMPKIVRLGTKGIIATPKSKSNKEADHEHKQVHVVRPWQTKPFHLSMCLALLLTCTFLVGLAVAKDLNVTDQSFLRSNPIYRQYNFCGRSQSGHAVHVPKTIKCTPPDTLNSHVHKAKVELWIPRSEPKVTKAAKCYIIAHKICTYYGVFFTKSVIENKKFHESVSYEECTRAMRMHVFKGKELTNHSENLWSTNKKPIFRYKYCCFTHCEITRNFVIEFGQIATMDGITMSSNLGDIGSCQSHLPQTCIVLNQRYVWQRKLTKLCPMVKKGVYSATVTGKHVIIERIQGAFSKINTQKPLACLPTGSIVTDQGVVIKIVNKLEDKYFWSSTESRHKLLTAKPDPINGKLEYLKEKIIEMEKRDFRNLWLELCNMAQRQLTLIWQFLRLDATMGARVLLNRDDIHATFAGEALMTWPCQKIIPDEIFWNSSVMNTCYEFVPIKVKGEIFFIVPGTNDLTTHSLKVPCIHHLSAIYRTKDQEGATRWTSPTGYVNVIGVPIELTWKDLWEPFTFTSSALFHDHLMGQIPSLALLKSYVYRINTLESQLDKVINYTSEFSTDPQLIRKTITATQTGVKKLLHSTGKGISHIWTGIGLTTRTLLSNILKGTWQFILNICIILIVLGIVSILLFQGVLKCKSYILQGTCEPCSQFKIGKHCLKGGDKQRSSNDISLSGRQEHEHESSLFEGVIPNTEIEQDSQNENADEQEVKITEIRPLKVETGHRIDYVCSNHHPTTLTRLVISLNINGIQTNCLVDTGSSITLISWKQLSIINNKDTTKRVILKDSPTGLEAKSVTGHTLHILGVADLDFALPTSVVRHSVVVIPDVGPTFDAIIGLDFMHKFHYLSVNVTRAEVSMGDNIFRFESTYSAAYASKKHIIPAYSAKVVCCHVHRPYPNELNMIFEPNTNFLVNKNLAAEFTVAQVQSQKIPVLLLNSTESAKVIKPNRVLGMCYPLIKSQIIGCENICTMTQNQSIKENTVSSKTPSEIKPIMELNHEQQHQFDKLVLKYCDIFALSDHDLGQTSILEHKIDTRDAVPIRQKPYPVPFSQRELIERHIHQMKNLGIIQPSASPWASPIVIVKKKDGTDRFCVDYRKLNNVTVKDVYPLPRIDDILYTLSNTKFYTSLDLLSGYWQVEVAKEDRQKTAFTSHFGGLWEFKVLPFGLCNAPSTFQRLVEIVLRGYLWKFCFCYIDDILIASSTFDEHMIHLGKVFQRLQEANLRVKTRKCQFLRPEITFLGHIVSKNGIQVDPEKTNKVMNFPTPQNVTELKSFLGLASYYRRFVDNFAAKATHLHKLLKKDVEFIWTNDCEVSFQNLKESLSKPPVLAYPDFSKPFVIQTDASLIGLGAVLAQSHEHESGKVHEHPIAYASRVLTQMEKKLPPIELEAMAVVFAFKQFRPYIYGHHVIVETDHAPLKWLLTTSLPSGRLQKPALKLAEFDFEIHYKPGTSNRNADALSRRPSTHEHHVNYTISESNDLILAQKNDPYLKSLIDYLVLGQLPKDDNEARSIVLIAERYTVIDNILYHLDSSTHKIQQLAVPEAMKTEILQLAHNHILAGHFGLHKTYHKIKQTYHWPNMYKDTQKFCKTCIDCQLRKPRHPTTKMPLNPIPVEGPMDKMAVDILGPLTPASEEGHKYIIIYTEYLTRWVEAFPLYDIKATTVAKTFVHGIVCRYGAPRHLLSDKGTNFLSELVNEVCQMLSTKKINTTAYHPQCDGLVERFNKTLVDILAMYISSGQQNWHELLPYALFAYRTSIHSSLKETPYYLMFGHDARLPQETALSAPSRYIIDIDDYKYQLQTFLHSAWKFAHLNLSQAQANQEIDYNKKAKIQYFKQGDLVLLHKPAVESGLNKKFHRPWTGPFRVLEVTDKTALIQPLNKPDALKDNVSLDRLKHYFQPYFMFRKDKQTHDEQIIIKDKKRCTSSNRSVVHNYNLRPRK